MVTFLKTNNASRKVKPQVSPYGNVSQEINYNPCFTLSIYKGNFRESTDNRNYSCKPLSNSHINTPGKVKAKSSLNLQNYNPCVTLCFNKGKIENVQIREKYSCKPVKRHFLGMYEATSSRSHTTASPVELHM